MDFILGNIACTNRLGKLKLMIPYAFSLQGATVSSLFLSLPFIYFHRSYISFKTTHKINFLIQIPRMNPPRNEFPSLSAPFSPNQIIPFGYIPGFKVVTFCGFSPLRFRPKWQTNLRGFEQTFLLTSTLLLLLLLLLLYRSIFFPSEQTSPPLHSSTDQLFSFSKLIMGLVRMSLTGYCCCAPRVKRCFLMKL